MNSIFRAAPSSIAAGCWWRGLWLLAIPLGQSQLRSKHGVTVVAIKRPGEQFTYATADTVASRHDLLVIAGARERVERFAELS